MIVIEPLTATAFAPFGQVLDTAGAHFPINGGMTERFNDLARIELGGSNPRPILSLMRGQPYQLPLTLEMVERHPLGSQAFMPLGPLPFLVMVAPDEGGQPGQPRAFLTAPRQGVNIAINTWHGVLTPLEAVGDFVVVDWAGDGVNLEEHFFAEPYRVVLQDQ